MLTDTKLRNLKPKESDYKVADRDGMYVAVLKTGGISFRYNYKLNGRQETVTLGRYGVGGITLTEARQRLHEAKTLVAEGKSPALTKSRRKSQAKDAKTFGSWADKWLAGHDMAESTRDMRRSVYERDVRGKFENRLLSEITSKDVRDLAEKIVERGAPATAVHAREIVLMVYRWATDRGENVSNPAESVRPTTIAKFSPRDRALTPGEIKLFYRYLDRVQSSPVIRAACKLLLLTMVRKGELIGATWDEVNFTSGVWTIPKERMKRRNPHNVYLSQQALDIFVALRTFCGGSRYVLPSRYDPDEMMSKATFNRVMAAVCTLAADNGEELESFGPHDLRRTASTLLHEAGYNSDWIEKCLAHEQRGVRGVYNKAEFKAQRTEMLQDWADMIDEWTR